MLKITSVDLEKEKITKDLPHSIFAVNSR